MILPPWQARWSDQTPLECDWCERQPSDDEACPWIGADRICDQCLLSILPEAIDPIIQFFKEIENAKS